MPVKVIDPHQNQHQEGKFGVIHYVDESENTFAVYNKFIFTNMRYRLAGWLCECQLDPNPVAKEEEFDWRGIVINRRVARIRPLPPEQQPPVVREIYDRFNHNSTRRLMIRNGLRHPDLPDHHRPEWSELPDDFKEIINTQ